MEHDITYKHLLDLARSAARLDVRHSRFLNPAQTALAERAAKEMRVAVKFWGGYEDAEYVMARFCNMGSESDWPISRLRVEWNQKYGRVGHRDLLGAIMGLGLTRDSIGDIAVSDDVAFVFATDEAGRYILSNLQEAGRVKLKLSEGEAEEVPPPKGRLERETVASMRLDALIAKVYALSRERAKLLVERGDVRLNHVEAASETRLERDDLVSVRSLGRFRVASEPKLTKKGRLCVQIMKYGDLRNESR